MEISSINPANGQQIALHAVSDDLALRMTLTQARKCIKPWAKTPVLQRAEKLIDLAAVLEKDKNMLAHSISQEMGKPITQAREEIQKCADVARYYAEHGPAWLADKTVDDVPAARIVMEPLGMILAIMPWNFPFWQVLRLAIPAWLAGNVVLLKHAPNVWGSAKLLEKACLDAGFARGLLTPLWILPEQLPAVVEQEELALIAFTGSPETARSVTRLAGHYLKRTLLELGGSDPYIVLADADLDQAMSVTLESRMSNTGQVCIAAKRLIVLEQHYEACLEKLTEGIKNYLPKDPLDETCRLGPLARLDLLSKLDLQCEQSLEMGAKLLVHDKTLCPEKGFYYPATLIAEVSEQMPIFKQEVFGPILPVIRAKDEDHALALANNSRYGLSAVVFSQDRKRGRAFADQLKVGSCYLNQRVRSHPALPFGGVKQSGYGRECSAWGLEALVNLKTLVI